MRSYCFAYVRTVEHNEGESIDQEKEKMKTELY